MKIAQIAPLFESVPPKLYGGTERVVHSLSSGLVAAGHEVTTFCSGDSTTAGEISAICPEALRLSTKQIRDPFAYSIRTLQMVYERSNEFDLIHNHYDYALFPLSRMTNTPLLTTLHGRLDIPEDIHAVYSCFEDHPVISISNSQRSPMPNLNWISTIHHGIDLTNYKLSKSPGKYLAFLGRFSPEKKAHWAIDIALSSGIPLKIAAKIESASLDYYEAEIKNRIDGKFIEYLGEISEAEKSDFLGNALALVFPIDWPEPFGLVMIEAMACGTPVLARPCGSVPEILIDGKTGFVRNNIFELSELAESAGNLDRGFIRQYVEQNFSVQRMTQEYIDVYQSLRQISGAAKKTKNDERVAHHRRNLLYPVHRTIDRNTKNIA